MKDIKGVIFDFDGVLVDTAKYHFQSWKKLANRLGFDFTEEQNEQLKGISRVDSLKLILTWGNMTATPEECIAYAKEKNDNYVESISTLTQDDLLPGVLAFFEDLKQNEIPFSIGSASKNATRIARTMNIVDLFVEIVDGNKVTKSKPDPEVFLIGSNAMNLKPENIVIFEDSQSGLEAANTANFMSVGVGTKENLSNTNHHIPGFQNFLLKDLIALLN